DDCGEDCQAPVCHRKPPVAGCDDPPLLQRRNIKIRRPSIQLPARERPVMESIDPKEARQLGMDRRISRRDFLNGIAVGAATTLTLMENGEPAIAQQPPTAAASSAEYYPPAQSGLRGSHAGSFEVAHRVRDGAYRQFPAIDVDTKEIYDLVVVGGGISGMAAAFFFQNALGRDKPVL